MNDDNHILWKHSSLTNKLMIEMYKSLLNRKIVDNFSSAGLLHDIGKIVIQLHYPEQYKEITRLMKVKKDYLDYKLEEQVMNITHNELGAYLLNWWEIPPAIVEVALFHDTPAKSNELNKELVSMVHLASYYSWRELDKERYVQLDKNIFNYIGFTEEQCENLIRSLMDEVK